MTVLLSNGARERLSIASRILAAVIGGYMLASAINLLIGLAPLPDASGWGELSSFAVHAAILLWVFHVRSATRAWVCLITATAIVYALCWLALQFGRALS